MLLLDDDTIIPVSDYRQVDKLRADTIEVNDLIGHDGEVCDVIATQDNENGQIIILTLRDEYGEVFDEVYRWDDLVDLFIVE
jgi:hypothetical protein